MIITLDEFCCTPGFLLPDTQSDQPLSCHIKNMAHWDVFDAGIISDLILNQILPFSPFLPCGTLHMLQGVSLVSVKYQNDLFIVSLQRHQSSIETFTDRVRTGHGNPGKSSKLKNKNPGPESPGIMLKVLESPGILNNEKRDCKNSIC